MMQEPTYSHSRINFYLTCPYGFDRKYNKGERGVGNWFSDIGSLVHKIHEDYYKVGAAKGLMWDEVRLVMVKKFLRGWKLITTEPPAMMSNIKEKRYNQILDYFRNFTPNPDMYAVEEHIEWELPDGTKMQCFIDEQIRFKEGAKKTYIGDIKPTYKKEYDEQLNTYCLAYKSKYGGFPSGVYVRQYTDGRVLRWDVHTPQEAKEDYPRQSDIKKTEQRLMDTVKLIKEDTEWKPKGDKFFCQNLCEFRNNCKFAVK